MTRELFLLVCSLVVASFLEYVLNLTVWDPNLTDFQGKFLRPQGLMILEVGRSVSLSVMVYANHA